MKIKKRAFISFSCVLVLLLLNSCNNKIFNPNSNITIISREDGSGTRGAFVDLFNIEGIDSYGNKIDLTASSADITQSTGVVIISVSQNINAIGYISLGALTNSIKALKIDNTEATVENIKNGSYTISRPFNLVFKNNLSETSKDFIDFILSADGQTVVEENSYISAEKGSAFKSSNPTGKITIAGSSSVTPVIEKLKEAYLLINPNAVVEINQSDSTTGVRSVSYGICDIGMASRDLKESEKTDEISSITIAMDGIALIVNPKNELDNLSKEQVEKIYVGKAFTWGELTN